MLAQYCQYCGRPLSEWCDCAREAAEDEARALEELEERSLVNAWQQDIIDLYRRER